MFFHVGLHHNRDAKTIMVFGDLNAVFHGIIGTTDTQNREGAWKHKVLKSNRIEHPFAFRIFYFRKGFSPYNFHTLHFDTA